MKQELEMEQLLQKAPFTEVEQQLESDRFWLKVFIRPCCPRPTERAARIKVEGLCSILSERDDFTEEQQASLLSLIEKREAWYIEHLLGGLTR